MARKLPANNAMDLWHRENGERHDRITNLAAEVDGQIYKLPKAQRLEHDRLYAEESEWISANKLVYSTTHKCWCYKQPPADPLDRAAELARKMIE